MKLQFVLISLMAGCFSACITLWLVGSMAIPFHNPKPAQNSVWDTAPPAFLSRECPAAIYGRFRSATEVREKEICIRLLFTLSTYLDGEFDEPVGALLDISHTDSMLFFNFVASDVPKTEYELWLEKIQPACFTDFPGEKDLDEMEARKVRLLAELRSMTFGDHIAESLRADLVDTLSQVKVHRVE